MDLLCAGLLLLLIGQAQGATYFLYQKKNETHTMVCKHNQWQIDINYDYKVDCNLTVWMKNKESSSESNEESDNCEKIGNYLNSNKSCTSKKPTRCFIVENPEKNNGFFACVDTFQSQFIYPFKSTVKQNDYFIIAFAKPDVLEPLPQIRKKSHINIHEGEPIILICNFSFSRAFSNLPYVVYWIKTGGEGSTCVYSYEFNSQKGIHYDIHCSLENNLQTRVSNTTSNSPLENPHHHNLTIINGTHSDSGQYVCALNVIKGNEGSWVVISNVTVTVDKKEQENQNTIHLSVEFALLYLAVALLIISIFAIAIYMKRKSSIATESQFVRKERHQNGDESIHPDISPYSVAGREFEPYSVVKLAAKPAAHGVEGDQAKLPTEPYSIIRLTPQCNTLGRSQEDRKLEHPEKLVDTGALVYESINDTYSTCK